MIIPKDLSNLIYEFAKIECCIHFRHNLECLTFVNGNNKRKEKFQGSPDFKRKFIQTDPEVDDPDRYYCPYCFRKDFDIYKDFGDGTGKAKAKWMNFNSPFNDYPFVKKKYTNKKMLDKILNSITV